jgi:hypothetical protein
LRWIHLASVGVFGGALVMLLVLAGAADPLSPLSFGAVRQAMSIAAALVLVPALLILLVTGFLLLVARPLLIDARWVWAKAAIGVAIAGISFFSVYPAMNRATGYAVQSAAGSVIQSVASAAADVRAPLERALAEERSGRWLNLALAMLATALAVWRPRLGGRARLGPTAPSPTATPSPTSPTSPTSPESTPSIPAARAAERWSARGTTPPPAAWWSAARARKAGSPEPAARSAAQAAAHSAAASAAHSSAQSGARSAAQSGAQSAAHSSAHSSARATARSAAHVVAQTAARSAVVIALPPRPLRARPAAGKAAGDGSATTATVTVLPTTRRARSARLRRVP